VVPSLKSNVKPEGHSGAQLLSELEPREGLYCMIC
jgi:hypothetical protein